VSTDSYMFGRSTGELQRLARQAALVEPETEELFLRSGITAGMRVLEIGSGAGDVAILAGRLVRPNGSVHGIERSADSVSLATGRAAAAANVETRFEVGDINTYQPSTIYDALVGRFVLPYLDDPPNVLRRLASCVRPGGVIAFMEFDVTRIGSVPEAPLFQAMAAWIKGAFEGSGIDPGLGSSLGAIFRDAGLPWPHMTSFQKASCGPDGFYWLFAETVRTLLPCALVSPQPSRSTSKASPAGCVRRRSPRDSPPFLLVGSARGQGFRHRAWTLRGTAGAAAVSR
jgi:SAM-dependent methyltransferase